MNEHEPTSSSAPPHVDPSGRGSIRIARVRWDDWHLMASDPEVTATSAMGIVARASELLWYPYTARKGKLALRLTRFLFARDWHRRLARRRR
jgi:hypothetical protein